MKTKKLKLMAICMAAALCAQLSSAQQTDGSRKPVQDKSSSTGASEATNGLHAGKLIGAQVKANDGENLGKLDDLVIDPQTGKITFAIVGKGGVLNIGEKRVPIPWQAVSIDAQGRRMSVNVDRDKMQTAPTVQSEYTELDNPEFAVVVYEFYEIPAGGSGDASETEKGSSGKQKP